MALINSDVVPFTGGAYELEQSLRFNDNDSSYLEWTPSSSGTSSTVWTFSWWQKSVGSNNSGTEVVFGAADGSNRHMIRFDGSGQFEFYQAATAIRVSTAKFRDNSAWYHFVVNVNGTSAAVYVNGEELTDFSSSNSPSGSWYIGNAYTHRIGRDPANADYQDGYLSEVNFIDGQALDATYFGETGTYGEWKPKEYSGTYGTNGFYLPFKNDYAVEGFSTVTYTGNGSTQYVGGVGFQPDWVWIKSRSITNNHSTYDAVRGTAYRLVANDTASEAYQTNKLRSFDSDGFTTDSATETNSNGNTFVAWCWDMGDNNPTGFGAIRYTGNGSTHSKTGFGFQPDLVWLKRRNAADSHGLFDAVRGSTKWVASDQTWAELTTSNSLTSFDKDGFTLGSYSNYNYSGDTFVAYGWDMGNETVSNTNGTITSTVRANTTYGQSIVSYVGNQTQGATVGHGLSSAPELIIIKNRDSISPWAIYHTSLGANNYLRFDTAGTYSSSTRYPSVPSSTVFTIGSDSSINGDLPNQNLIAYCFHSVSGYSKFGSYTGDGTTDGSKTISLGFRPAFVIIKRTDATTDWKMFDNVRSPLNAVDKIFQPNNNNAESTYDTIEFNDTSFGLLDNGGAINNSGSSYIYIAFAGGADAISDYNTDGSVDSRVKANTAYGQSIFQYTGTGSNLTVGHGLSSAPDMVIVKGRTTTRDWTVYHSSMGASSDMLLNLTNPENSSATTTWANTSPTSSVVSIGTLANVNESGQDYIGYAFHSVSGYSKFGSYTGNASSNSITGLGFAPAWVMIKSTTATAGWVIFDIVRNTAYPLLPNSNVAEDTLFNTWESFDSDGFTLNGANGEVNASGAEYIYMAYADTREFAYWLDQSGNNNDWTSNNLTESDISVDSPTNNFATLNSILPSATSTVSLLSEGSLKTTNSSTGSNKNYHLSTMRVDSGKWYMEYYGTHSYTMGGVTYFDASSTENYNGSGGITYFGTQDEDYAYFGVTGEIYTNSSGTSYGATYGNGDIIGVALDLDSATNTVTFYKNNTSQGSYTLPSGKSWVFAVGQDLASNYHYLNFGQDSSFAGTKTAQGNTDSNEIGDFYYTPPSGYLALCTANLPDPAVIPSENFNTVLWTGNGSTQSITGVGFQPDFIWNKERSTTGYHGVWDVVRGINKSLSTNVNAEEQANSGKGITSFDSDGFTAVQGSWAELNSSSASTVTWCRKAGGSGVSNTDGSITSTVSANPDAGFSIVKYTGNGSDGATIGHGLTKGLELVIIKGLATGRSWWVNGYPNNPAFSQDGALITLHESNPMAYSSGRELSLGSSTITIVDSDTGINDSGDVHIAYCFHSVEGFSKVGSYTGNGSTDGTFVYTGFRPAWIMYRNRDASENWVIHDTKRDVDNLVSHRVDADRSNAEDSTVSSTHPNIDILSNGFKHRASGAVSNSSGAIFLYLAFAENPFKYTNAR